MAKIYRRNELRVNNTFFIHKMHHKYTLRIREDQEIVNRTKHYKKILDVIILKIPNVERNYYLILYKIRFSEGWKERNEQIKTEEKVIID